MEFELKPVDKKPIKENRKNVILKEELNYKKNLSLQEKIKYSDLLIKQFYNKLNGNVYIAFSGGIDSTVLLDLVRKNYPNILAVRVVEPSYKELNMFVNSIDNVDKLNPKRNFKYIINKYGYPIISKEISCYVDRYRNTKSEDVKKFRLTGIRKDGTKAKVGFISKKWRFLVDAPFKISDRCCNFIKKYPFKNFEKKNNLKPFIGTKSVDSNNRLRNYLKYGCNIFDKEKEKSRPLSFWREIDIWNYVRSNKLNYCSLYDMGEKNLGCIFCMFGVHLESVPNRFQRMYHINKKVYNYAMNILDIKSVLDYIKIDYTPIQKLEKYFDIRKG